VASCPAFCDFCSLGTAAGLASFSPSWFPLRVHKGRRLLWGDTFLLRGAPPPQWNRDLAACTRLCTPVKSGHSDALLVTPFLSSRLLFWWCVSDRALRRVHFGVLKFFLRLSFYNRSRGSRVFLVRDCFRPRQLLFNWPRVDRQTFSSYPSRAEMSPLTTPFSCGI